MTTDALRKPTTRVTEAEDTVRTGPGAEGRPPTTTVPVMPLWERLSRGGRG
ncbi:hypothetical protein ABZ016_05050 [Streptomyces sp. NPDC006372]|uniref:hypothetical protein n=1 Tax=Streptomyces sp. NPDC006372 TaxID=3155599 RepID=UPI0033A6A674